ncbi:hypothetical protein A2Z33_04020 [Candidatus Gottesmanbacteria bacterium RBG_16_52_11]|uniref:Uncharacterized protein n=1 Tax=Candidatus Gottesmanbacteria bacterium RBG_16_52_11 TaxID=1798374 RepID=A0A1F5YVS1_9BACT|nr:MAG: hypothetical protein A2Z33_04020 [Candidatus Gottesmanbacteria bacterium RBG_16_52_11]
MISVLASILLFIATLVIHIMVRRPNARSIGIGKVVADFAVACILAAVAIVALGEWFRDITPPLPLTGIAIYGFAAFSYVSFSASPFLGDESPSSVIVLLAREKGSMTLDDVLSEFPDRSIVDKRIADLISTGWIKRTRKGLVATGTGRIIAAAFGTYRRLLGLGETG